MGSVKRSNQSNFRDFEALSGHQPPGAMRAWMALGADRGTELPMTNAMEQVRRWRREAEAEVAAAKSDQRKRIEGMTTQAALDQRADARKAFRATRETEHGNNAQRGMQLQQLSIEDQAAYDRRITSAFYRRLGKETSELTKGGSLIDAKTKKPVKAGEKGIWSQGEFATDIRGVRAGVRSASQWEQADFVKISKLGLGAEMDRNAAPINMKTRIRELEIANAEALKAGATPEVRRALKFQLDAEKRQHERTEGARITRQQEFEASLRKREAKRVKQAGGLGLHIHDERTQFPITASIDPKKLGIAAIARFHGLPNDAAHKEELYALQKEYRGRGRNMPMSEQWRQAIGPVTKQKRYLPLTEGGFANLQRQAKAHGIDELRISNVSHSPIVLHRSVLPVSYAPRVRKNATIAGGADSTHEVGEQQMVLHAEDFDRVQHGTYGGEGIGTLQKPLTSVELGRRLKSRQARALSITDYMAARSKRQANLLKVESGPKAAMIFHHGVAGLGYTSNTMKRANMALYGSSGMRRRMHETNGTLPQIRNQYVTEDNPATHIESGYATKRGALNWRAEESGKPLVDNRVIQNGPFAIVISDIDGLGPLMRSMPGIAAEALSILAFGMREAAVEVFARRGIAPKWLPLSVATKIKKGNDHPMLESGALVEGLRFEDSKEFTTDTAVATELGWFNDLHKPRSEEKRLKEGGIHSMTAMSLGELAFMNEFGAIVKGGNFKIGKEKSDGFTIIPSRPWLSQATDLFGPKLLEQAEAHVMQRAEKYTVSGYSTGKTVPSSVMKAATHTNFQGTPFTIGNTSGSPIKVLQSEPGKVDIGYNEAGLVANEYPKGGMMAAWRNEADVDF